VLQTHRPASTLAAVHPPAVRNGRHGLRAPAGVPAGAAGSAGSTGTAGTFVLVGPGTNGSVSAAVSVSGAPAVNRAPGPREAGSVTKPVTVAVLAGDAITGQGAVAFLRSHPDVRVLSVDRQHEAEVVLVIVDTVTEDTLKIIECAAQASTTGDTRFVLVGDGMREHHVLRVASCGLVSVIPRREADFEHVLRAIVDVREGWLQMPGDALGWLAGWLRAIQREVLEPQGLTATGLEKREVDVLRLLAEGLGTPEIAVRLNYSERTVKNIIHGVLTRLNLRNRTQAVAFAVRSGAF
jgi:DNA-binding NarL/FixJ family response regulator